MMIRISLFFRVAISVVLLVATLLGASTTALAANALLEFSDTLKSFSANFTQTVYDADSVVLQESTGVVVLARPGRFKWTYEAPITQVIVADGLTLWVYDEEIKQVTKQPQSTTLGSAPIGLLSGQRDIESEFVITELGDKDDLAWFQLQPLVSDTDFNEIFLALDNDGLHAMELRDNFDQATQIVFSEFKKNVSIDTEQFTFVVPEGVDVVGEGGVPENQDDLLIDEAPTSTEQGVTEPASTQPASIEQSDSPSQSGGTLPAAISSTDVPTDTDPLLADDTVESSTTELLDEPGSGGTDQAGSEENNLSENNSEDTGMQDSDKVAPGTDDPVTDNRLADPNSDKELLGVEAPAAEPADSPTQPAADETPLVNTADPKREITFEEQKVIE